MNGPIAYQAITLAGTEDDVVSSGRPIILYGYQIRSSDGDFQFYNGTADYIAGDPITLFHRTGDTVTKSAFFPAGLEFSNGCVIEGTTNDLITVFYTRI